jgi:hypothetical protein
MLDIVDLVKRQIGRRPYRPFSRRKPCLLCCDSAPQRRVPNPPSGVSAMQEFVPLSDPPDCRHCDDRGRLDPRVTLSPDLLFARKRAPALAPVLVRRSVGALGSASLATSLQRVDRRVGTGGVRKGPKEV